MKRKISDLLADYPEGEINLNEVTPLSAERIRQRTMAAIAPSKKQAPKAKRTHRGGRILFRLLVAAAILSTLTVTAFAVENLRTSEWFQSIMNSKQAEQQQLASEYSEEYEAYTIQETVSQGQLELVDQLGEGFQPQTVVSNGTTMTLTAGYGDESVMHLYLQVTAPEGTVLPDDISYESMDFGSGEEWKILTMGDTVLSCHLDIEPLEDDDPTDNRKDFHLTLTLSSAPESLTGEQRAAEALDTTQVRLNDGVEKHLHLKGLYSQIVDVNGEEDGYEPILTGDFSFDITYSSKPTEYVLDVSNMTYGGHAVRKWSHPADVVGDVNGHFDWCPPYDENGVHTEEWDYTVTPTYFAINPMSVYWSCDFTCTDERMYYNLSFKVVMKDGTSPLTTRNGGWDSGNTTGGTSHFYNPIDLTQVDYILIGDEDLGSTYKLYLPQ